MADLGTLLVRRVTLEAMERDLAATPRLHVLRFAQQLTQHPPQQLKEGTQKKHCSLMVDYPACYCRTLTKQTGSSNTCTCNGTTARTANCQDFRFCIQLLDFYLESAQQHKKKSSSYGGNKNELDQVATAFRRTRGSRQATAAAN
jgi:hypothetical protein